MAAELIPFQAIVDKEIIGQRQGKKEVKSWHCSKIGGCLRGAYLERLGEKPDKEFTERELRVFDCGRFFEQWIIDLAKKSTDLKIETQVRVESKDLDVTGYADAVIGYNGHKKIYEIKSKHSRSFWYMLDKKEGPNRQHECQLWLYLKILGIEEGSLIYLSKDDLTIAEFPVLLKDEKLAKETLEQVGLLNKAWKDKNPKLLPLPEAGTWQAKYCRYHSQCQKL